jgi:hypothetical protein
LVVRELDYRAMMKTASVRYRPARLVSPIELRWRLAAAARSRRTAPTCPCTLKKKAAGQFRPV